MNNFLPGREYPLRMIAAIMAVIFGLFISYPIFNLRLANDGSDIHNYIRLYDRFSSFVGFEGLTWLEYLTKEVLFHYLFEVLSVLLGSPEFALRFISFVAASAVFYKSITTGAGWLPVSILLAFHPRFLDLFSSQQRFALALAVFVVLCGALRGRWLAVSAVGLGAIHTYFVVLGGAVVVRKVSRVMLGDSRVRLFCVALVLAFVTTVLSEYILDMVGDRRIDADRKTLGGLYAVMWLITYGVILFSVPNLILSLPGFLFAMSAASAVLATLSGIYAERFVAASIVFLMISSVRLDAGALKAVFLVIALNLVFSHYYWVQSHL